MHDQVEFATFPHFFSDTLRFYRHTNVVYLNTVVGNTEQFVKRNFRVRIITNTVLPGAYEYDLALIENDRFLLSNVDIRRLQQLADTMDFDASKSEIVERNGVELPAGFWEYAKEVRELPVFARTPYHRATLHYFLWQLAKYYLITDGSRSPGINLTESVRFYLREVRRPFRSNREVNEAHRRVDRETLENMAARVLMVDVPPVDGYRILPSFIQAREVLVREQFDLQDILPPEYFFGSRFNSEDAYIEWISEFLGHCQHMQIWLMIVRDTAMLPSLGKMLEAMKRRSRSFSHPIAERHNFSYLVSQPE